MIAEVEACISNVFVFSVLKVFFLVFLCVQNFKEARRVMQGRNPPQNCIQAFSKDGDQIFTNRNYTSDQTRANYLTGDVEEEIRCVCP